VRLFGKKKEEVKKQEKNEADKLEMRLETKKAEDLIFKELLPKMPEPKTLKGIVEKNFAAIRNKNEMPSLGHGLDLVHLEWRNRLSPQAMRAYKSGYFHMIPIFLAGADEIERLGTVEFDTSGNGILDTYSMPNQFMLLEIAFPEQMQKLHKPIQRRTKEEIVNEFQNLLLEPVFREILPKFMVQAQYKKFLLYLIYEFETDNQAQEFIDATRLFLTGILRSKSSIQDISSVLHYENNILDLDLPMRALSESKKILFRAWWRYGSIVFSTTDVGSEGERRQRLKRSTALFIMHTRNKHYIKSSIESTQGHADKLKDHGAPSLAENMQRVPENKEVRNIVNEGVRLFENKKYEEALQKFMFTIQSNPENAIAHRWIGITKMQMQDYKSAENELQKAIELNPCDDVAYNYLGGLYDKLNRIEEAEQLLKKAVELNPNNAVNHYNYATLLSKCGKKKEAWSQCKETLKIDPSFMMAYGELFSLLMKREDLNEEENWALFLESEQMFRHAIENFPKVASLHGYLGYVSLCTDRKDEAEKEFRKALELDSRNQIAQPFMLLKKKDSKTWNSIGIKKPKQH